MKLMLDIKPLIDSGLKRGQIIATLASGHGTTTQIATLRLERACSTSTDSLRRDVLAHLFRLAEDRGVRWWKLLQWGPRTLLDLLPGTSTLTYVGGYGAVDGEDQRYTETITASVSDYRAARRFAQRITRDYSRLRFAPSMAGDECQIVTKLKAEMASADEGATSIISVGSSKINTMSEWLTARALGLTAFRPRAAAQEQPPVELVYAILDAQRSMFLGSVQGRCNSRLEPAENIGHSYLVCHDPDDQREYRYRPPAEAARSDGDSGPQGGSPGTDGTDYAVVLVEGLTSTRANIVVSGLTGGGTYGASALICHDPQLFELPASESFVRLYLVEVRLKRGVCFRLPDKARVFEHWTKSTGKFTSVDTGEFSSLGVMSLGQEPGMALPALEPRHARRADVLAKEIAEFLRSLPADLLDEHLSGDSRNETRDPHSEE